MHSSQAPLQGRRIAVIGQAGSGKSTLGRALGGRLGIPHTELDALNWAPDWVGLSRADPPTFIARVRAAAEGEAWVIDGNYRVAQPLVLARATDLVWLDYGRTVIMARVIRRSFARAVDRRELWPGTGNRESFARWLDKEHPIRWTWDTFDDARNRREAIFADGALAQARKHRFRSPRETERWLADVRPG